ncbi:LysE family transporter [Glycomyces sp. TRM65418]|uniref:LysE/ArgO family amino acid transporter n=1 Tax=Glycomyces sp. TRM65418 TaxID=2867006 RepID=UPI001CE67EFB|nr:LysE family transporter [Glycomyces sp. TRM65418]MCC3763390.1 LysE family transporter [Glycomyces sp. TRM65418]QZD57381.1 LysE family transporter [Glycomyces sp. TRM65418]
MTAAFFTGLALGLALIVPIGAQNVFVFGQAVTLGMPRALWAVVGAAACDTLLIVLGAAGTSALLNSVPGLRPAMLLAGALFLTYLGVKSLRTRPAELDDQSGVWSRGQVLRRTAAVSLLNPHAILDTVGVLGAAITAQAVATRVPFAVGAVIASWTWFLVLATAAHAMRRFLTKERRVWFDRVSGLILLVFAVWLAVEFTHTLA